MGGGAACRPLEIGQRKNCPPSGPQPWLLATSASLPLSRGGQSTTPLAPLSCSEARVTLPTGESWVLCRPLAWWEEQNGASSRWSYEALAGVYVLCHCLLSVRELQKQVSRIWLSMPGHLFSFSIWTFSTEAAFRLINCNKLSLEFCILETTLPEENHYVCCKGPKSILPSINEEERVEGFNLSSGLLVKLVSLYVVSP